MKFIMVSKYGEGLGILHRIYQEGNDVTAFITEKDSREKWDGLIEKSGTLPYEKDSIYIFDLTGNGDIAEDLIRTGHYVVGGSKLADKLEYDRMFGLKAMEKVGIEVPEYKLFHDYKSAKEYIQNENEVFVFKPCGEALPAKLTYVPCDVEDLLGYLNYVENKFKGKTEFILQKFIEGVAVSTEGWFNGTHFVHPFDHTIENKKFSNENKGVATGCSGNVVWRSEESSLTRELEKISPIIQGYIGPIDLNAMVSKTGIYGLEWTPRFGYDASPNWMKIFEGDLGSFFYNLAHNLFEGEIPISDEFSGGIRVTIPPYPYDPIKDHHIEDSAGLPIRGIDADKFDDYYFYEVVEKDGNFVVAKGCGLLLVAMATANDFADSITLATDLAREIKVPDVDYRTDLDEVLTKDFEKFNSIMEEVYA